VADGPPPRHGNETYEWVNISDFSPGVYDGSHISTETPVVSAPLGAANAVGTYCCASIPGGALGPLPALTTQVAFTFGYPGSTTQLLLAGFSVTPQLVSDPYEIVSIDESDDGTDHYVRARSTVPGVGTNAITGPTITSATTPGFFGAPYPVFTRMTARGTGNPLPVLVFPTAVATDPSDDSGHLWVYPELASRTSYVAQDLISMASSTTGQTVAYASRIICFAGLEFTWPAGGGISSNENINYTDPPTSALYGDQVSTNPDGSFLGAEIPWGYGAWGSISVGELLIIKKYGGAVILNGDIANPTSVISVPGVESTGDFVGSAAATPSGLYYCSQNRGAWVWDGGNVSQKISKNINDSFFDMETNNITSNNYGFFCYHWQKWILFSKNLMYDTENQSWWVLYPNQGVNFGAIDGHDFFWYALTNDGNQLLTAPLIISTANGNIFYNVFDNTVANNFYQWTSLPIHVTKNADRVLDVRKVMIRASNPSGAGTANVAVNINGVAIGSSTGVAIGIEPTIISLNCGVKGVQDILVTLACTNTGSNPAPIIHSIDIGYEIRAEVKPNN
jgi:hypothetical protein